RLPQGGNRRHVYNRAAPAAPDRLDRPPSCVNGPEEIRFQHLGPVVEPFTSYGPRRVVDQNVKTPEGVFREGHKGPGVWLTFHVRAEERGTASGSLDQAHRFVATRLIDVGNDDGGASSRETSCNGATAAGTTGSRDSHHARVVQLSRHAADILTGN